MRINEQNRAGLDTIFQKMFHVAEPALNRSPNCFLMDSLGSCNFSFAHSEYVMGVDPPALRIRESVQGSAESLRRNLALVKLTGRKGNKKSFVLDTVPGVQRKIRIVPVSRIKL